MTERKLNHVLSLNDCAEILGIKRSGTHKRLKKHGVSMVLNEMKEIEVDSSQFAGKFPKETTDWLKGISSNVSKNDIGNNGKQVELEVKDKEIEGLRNQLFEKDQRLKAVEETFTMTLAAKEETIQTLRLLTDQSAKMAGQLPPETMAKIAALEAEKTITAQAAAKAEEDARALAQQLQEVQEIARRGVDIAPEELTELRRKAKIVDDNNATQEILRQLIAKHNALPFFKRLSTPQPTLDMAKTAFKEMKATEQKPTDQPAAKAG